MLFRALIAAAGNSAIPFSATGGTVTDITDGGINYKVHTFTSSGTFTVVTGRALEVEYLVVAGGGGGGEGYAGGGGAGGYRSSVVGESSGGGASAESKLAISSGSYTVTVGAGWRYSHKRSRFCVCHSNVNWWWNFWVDLALRTVLWWFGRWRWWQRKRTYICGWCWYGWAGLCWRFSDYWILSASRRWWWR